MIQTFGRTDGKRKTKVSVGLSTGSNDKLPGLGRLRGRAESSGLGQQAPAHNLLDVRQFGYLLPMESFMMFDYL